MASFVDNFRQIMGRVAQPGTSGNWSSGASKATSTSPNMYTNQSLIGGGYIPKDPTTRTGFVDQYRTTTKNLGALGKTLAKKGIDSETQSIIQRIKLPSYNDALSDEDRDEYMAIHNITPEFAEKSFNEEAEEWDKNNFYYKLRAAQVLKRLPEKEREGLLKNFDISAYDAKNTLDKVIASENSKAGKALQSLGEMAQGIAKGASDSVQDALLRASGLRKEYTDENGNRYTDTYSTGEGSISDLARRLRATNGESRLVSGGQAPSEQSNSATATEEETISSETPSGEETTEDVVEYTYKPGDTFGQVLKNLGLTTDRGLWGSGGDVEYYTRQLVEQGALDTRGNIPIGTTIKLRRRK